ncbi:alpha/beta hydrolase, partial [Bifidobacterium adolescentis]
ALGTAETAWQGVNGIEPCVQQWPVLANAWLRRLFA